MLCTKECARYRVLMDFGQRKVPTMTGSTLVSLLSLPLSISVPLSSHPRSIDWLRIATDPWQCLSTRHTFLTSFTLSLVFSIHLRHLFHAFLTKRSAHYHHHYPHRLRLPISAAASPTSSSASSSALSALGTHS